MNTQKVGRSKAAVRNKQPIEYHADNAIRSDVKPAICVKYHGPWPEGLTQEAIDFAAEQWWQDAYLLAQEHGYSGVFSEGRSDGWLVPFFQYGPDGKLRQEARWTGQGPEKGYPTYPDAEDAKQRKQFLRFRKAILAMMDDVPEQLRAIAAQS